MLLLLHFFYHILQRGYHPPSSQCFGNGIFKRYIYYWNLKLINNAILIKKKKTPLPREEVFLAYFGYPVQTLWFSSSEPVKLFGLLICGAYPKKIIPMCAYSNDIVICRKVLLSGQPLNRAHNFQIQSVRIPLTFYSTTKSCPPFRSTPKACLTFLSTPTRGGSRISSEGGGRT